jgi:uncharacterized protein (DUF1499 family)
MKITFIFIMGLLVLILLASIALSIYSHHVGGKAWQPGSPQLLPCSQAPNCVSSEADSNDQQHYIAPFHHASAATWQQLQQCVQKAGGTIDFVDDRHMHATFSTPWLRYMDDVEARWDADSGYIHWRSASRVGHSDFGVNRQRIESLRQALEEK